MTSVRSPHTSYRWRGERVIEPIKWIKERFAQSLGLKRRKVASCESRVHFPPLLSPAGSSGFPKSTPPAHSWNQVRAVTFESPLHVVTRCHKPRVGYLRFLSHEEESGECYTSHPDPGL